MVRISQRCFQRVISRAYDKDTDLKGFKKITFHGVKTANQRQYEAHVGEAPIGRQGAHSLTHMYPALLVATPPNGPAIEEILLATPMAPASAFLINQGSLVRVGLGEGICLLSPHCTEMSRLW